MKSKNVLKLLVLSALTFNFQLSTFNFLYAGPGTTGASFLKIGLGARAVGMGEAFVAVADDVSAIYWNPAGLSYLYNREATFVHNSWLQGINYENLSYVQKIGSLGSFGINIAYLGMDSMDRTREDGSGTYAGKDGRVDAMDFAVGLAYAREIGGFSVGTTIKILQERLAQYTATGFGADVGLLKKFEGVDKLAVGVNIQNIGTPLVFIDTTRASPLPLNVKLGASCKLLEDNLTLALDLNYMPYESKLDFHLGTEYWCNKVLALRLGYRTNSASDIDVFSGLTAGFGLRWEGCGIDYAFVPYGNLGQTHRFSIVASFGSSLPSAAARRDSQLGIVIPEVKAEVKGDAVLLSWEQNKEENVAGYKIYIRRSSDEKFKWVGIKPVNEPYFVLVGLEKGATYYFAVTAFTSDSPPRETILSKGVSATLPDLFARK